MLSSSSAHPAALTLRDCRISRGGREVVRVPALTLQPGELLHLSGANGAGKTTLLGAIGGVLPGQGEIRIGAAALPGSLAARQMTVLVPAAADLYDDLTVAEYLTFMAASWSSAAAPLFALARRLGLSGWLDAWPATLSRGTVQKVALAAALGLGRPLTLLDEPFNTLDAASQAVLHSALGERCAAGGAVVVTTHGPELAGLPCRTFELTPGPATLPITA